MCGSCRRPDSLGAALADQRGEHTGQLLGLVERQASSGGVVVVELDTGPVVPVILREHDRKLPQ